METASVSRTGDRQALGKSKLINLCMSWETGCMEKWRSSHYFEFTSWRDKNITVRWTLYVLVRKTCLCCQPDKKSAGLIKHTRGFCCLSEFVSFVSFFLNKVIKK